MDSAFGVELEAPLPPPKSGISPSFHTSPRECTGQGMLEATACISETQRLTVCLCHCSCNANPETVIRVLLVLRILTYMYLPPYDTGLNSGHKVCFRQGQESPPDTENWVRRFTANHHIPYCPAVKIPFLRPVVLPEKKEDGT